MRDQSIHKETSAGIVARVEKLEELVSKLIAPAA